MFAFPLFSIPLGFLAVSAWFFPRSEEERLPRYFGRGFWFALPCLLVHQLLRALVPALPGSPLTLFRIWWECFALPVGLAVGAFRLLHSYDETIRSLPSLRRFTAFLFGYYTVFGAAFALRATAFPGPFSLFFFPALCVASIFLTVFMTERIAIETGIYAALQIGLAVLLSVGLTVVAFLFEARLEWLGGILAVAALSASVYAERPILK